MANQAEFLMMNRFNKHICVALFEREKCGAANDAQGRMAA
jgi:hypothetical protein